MVWLESTKVWVMEHLLDHLQIRWMLSLMMGDPKRDRCYSKCIKSILHKYMQCNCGCSVGRSVDSLLAEFSFEGA